MNDAVHQQSSARPGDAAGPLLLGIDLGTSALKCGLFDLNGRRVMQARIPYRTWECDTGGEQNANDWWNALTNAVRPIVSAMGAENVCAIAIGGQAPSPVFLDKSFHPVARVVPWLDNRAAGEVAQIIHALGRRPSSGPERLMTQIASRAMWLRRMAPETFAQVHSILHSGDYLVARLTGRRVTTSPIVPHIFRAADLPLSLLPTVELEPGSIVGCVSPHVAQRLGLGATVPVVTAGLDSFLASVGAGICEEGDACLMTGSSAGVALLGPAHCIGRFQWGDNQVLSQTCKVGGRALEWVYRCTLPDEALAKPLAIAAEMKRPARSNHMVAELMDRSNCGDASPREMLVGLIERNDSTELLEILRMVLDAIFISQRNLLDQLEREAGRAGRIRAVGGLAACPQVVQLQSDILRRPIEVPAIVESGALGAAMCAAVAMGFYSHRDASLQMVRLQKVFNPRPKVSAEYDVAADSAALQANC